MDLMKGLEQVDIGRSVAALIRESAERYGDRPFLDFFEQGTVLSYRDAFEKASRLAIALNGMGVAHGTHVGVMLHTGPMPVIVWFALLSLGAVIVPVNDRYTARELDFTLRKADASFLVIGQDLVGLYESLADKPVPLGHVVVFGAEQDGSYRDLEALIASDNASTVQALREPLAGDLANLQFTSGTTGLPKAAMLTHEYWLVIARVKAAMICNRPRRLLIAQPLYYLDGQWLVLMTMVLGATAYLPNRQSASSFFGWVRKYDIEYCNFPEVVTRQEERPDDADNALVVMYCYSHRPESYALYEKRYGALARQGFGMTEAGFSTYVPFEASEMAAAGSIGIPTAFREVKVADPEGVEVAAGVIGELCVRGRGLFLGYYKDPQATAAAFHPGGWFRTGDLARRDDNGWFYFLGRIKDMVKRSGETIASVEVEAALRGHPQILEAAVVPVRDRDRGEEVKAYVLLRPGLTDKDVTPQSILEHCRASLARFKCPRYLEYVEEFPRTPSNKISKVRLLDAKPDLRVGSFDAVTRQWIRQPAAFADIK